MSHITGTVQTQSPALLIGPDSGAAPTAPNIWALNFAHAPAPGGTKLLILHFQNVSLSAANRLEVDLGYGTDVFTSADGPSFWTRPVNVNAAAGGLVPIRYVNKRCGKRRRPARPLWPRRTACRRAWPPEHLEL